MKLVMNARGHEIDFAAAVQLMDLDILEEVHSEEPETEQEFLESYAALHEAHFGEQFAPFAGGAW